MDATIAFMNDLAKKEAEYGTFQFFSSYNLESKGSCTLIHTMTWPGKSDFRFALRLETADPESVEIKTFEDRTKIFLARVARGWRPSTVKTKGVPKDLPFIGIISDIEGSHVKVVDLGGTEVSFTFANGTVVEEALPTRPGQVSESVIRSLSDLKINMLISIWWQKDPYTLEDPLRIQFTSPQNDDLLKGQETNFGVFSNKTTAERFAKALIHAVVLCHATDAPPF